MKLKLPSPVNVKGPTGETIEVSAAQVIEHVVRTSRSLGQCPEVEGVRTGARILSAVASGEIAEADMDELKLALSKPSRGWASVGIDIDVRVPPSAQNPTGIATQKRFFAPSAIDLLPLIDGLLAL